MRSLFLYLIALQIFITSDFMAQHKCKTEALEAGSQEVCLHVTGEISTQRFWDAQGRSGYFEAYSNTRKKLVQYDLRKFAGHASVQVDYHGNGQVSRVEYSSAPDGGIQFWHIIHHFDESGNETFKQDLSQPDGYPRVVMPDELRNPDPQYVVPTAPKKMAEPTRHVGIRIVNLVNKDVTLWHSQASDSVLISSLIPAGTKNFMLDTLVVPLNKYSTNEMRFRFNSKDLKRYEIEQLSATEELLIYAIFRKSRKSRRSQ
jgi:hypothetical protein